MNGDAIALSPEDDLVLTGDISQYMTLEVITLVHPPPSGVPGQFVARFDISGQPLWVDVLGTSGVQDDGALVALDTNDGVIASRTVMSVAGGDLNGLPAFTALDPNGATTWTARAVSAARSSMR